MGGRGAPGFTQQPRPQPPASGEAGTASLLPASGGSEEHSGSRPAAPISFPMQRSITGTSVSCNRLSFSTSLYRGDAFNTGNSVNSTPQLYLPFTGLWAPRPRPRPGNCWVGGGGRGGPTLCGQACAPEKNCASVCKVSALNVLAQRCCL